ncbi:MAG: class I SAM-dependent methyltransferase [Gammaproteobacteria bacterium]|jgi:predicted O-methyltransferase YrrM
MNIQQYIEKFITIDNKILNKLEQEYHNRNDIQPGIGVQAGRFLTWLVNVIQAKKVLEFGTCLGYSTVVLAEAVSMIDGRLVAIECDKKLCDETRKNLIDAKLDGFVTLINANASEAIKNLDGGFDLILQDSNKSLYTKMLDDCVEKLNPHGIIVADDTLFTPMGIDKKYSQHMDAYNKMVFADTRLISTILPIGDGLTISVKK